MRSYVTMRLFNIRNLFFNSAKKDKSFQTCPWIMDPRIKSEIQNVVYKQIKTVQLNPVEPNLNNLTNK